MNTALQIPVVGQRLSASFGRQLVQNVNALRITGGPGVRVTSGPNGVTISAVANTKQTAGASSETYPFKLKVEYKDKKDEEGNVTDREVYLLCRCVDAGVMQVSSMASENIVARAKVCGEKYSDDNKWVYVGDKIYEGDSIDTSDKGPLSISLDCLYNGESEAVGVYAILFKSSDVSTSDEDKYKFAIYTDISLMEMMHRLSESNKYAPCEAFLIGELDSIDAKKQTEEGKAKGQTIRVARQFVKSAIVMSAGMESAFQIQELSYGIFASERIFRISNLYYKVAGVMKQADKGYCDVRVSLEGNEGGTTDETSTSDSMQFISAVFFLSSDGPILETITTSKATIESTEEHSEYYVVRLYAVTPTGDVIDLRTAPQLQLFEMF